MSVASRKEVIVLFLGDILVLMVSLWLALFIRYTEFPSFVLYDQHLTAFAILFVIWMLVFFIFGLYEKHTLLLKSRVPTMLFHAQIINSIIAVFLFYFFPFFSIAPKVNLFLNLIIALVLLVFWRLYILPRLGFGRQQNSLLVGGGEEMRKLLEEVNNNSRYKLKFILSLDLDKLDNIDFKDEVLGTVYSENITVIVIDLHNKKIQTILPHFYNLIFSRVRFIDMHKVYEDIFDRVPLSLVNYNWFLENISSSTKMFYDILKRLMDICVSVTLGVMLLVLYPFIFLAIKLEDGGVLFFTQERVGKNNKPIYIRKFRTMSGVDKGDEVLESRQTVTLVGGFLRKTRLDEIPQLWNVFIGDVSLIGPRPEIPELAKCYAKDIPYYNIRHLIKPGLSGWAQIYHEGHPHHGIDIAATREKLSYDFYYVKNRSFMLDIKIALKTVKIILSRSGV